MTAPVETRYPTATLEALRCGEGRCGSFVSYRSLDVVPQAVAQNIQIADIPPMMVMSIGVRGGYDYDNYTNAIKRCRIGWRIPEYEDDWAAS